MKKIFLLVCLCLIQSLFPSAGRSKLPTIYESTNASRNKEAQEKNRKSLVLSKPAHATKPQQPPLERAFAEKYSQNFNKDTLAQITGALLMRGLKPRAILNHERSVRAVKWSANRSALLTGSEDATAVIWSKDGEKLHTLNHGGAVMVVDWNPQGTRVLTGSYDKTAVIWNAITGKQMKKLDHLWPVNTVAWSPEENYVATAAGVMVSFWNGKKSWQSIDPRQHQSNVASLKWVSPRKFSTVVLEDNSVEFLAKAAIKTSPMKGLSAAECRTMSPDKTMFLAMNPLRLCNTADKTTRFILANRAGYYNNGPYSWASDSKFVAVQYENYIEIYDAKFGTCIHTLVHPRAHFLNSLDWRLDGNAIASGGDDATAQVWDTGHLKDPVFNAQYDQLRNGLLNPAQRMMLLLCNKYKKQLYALCRACTKMHHYKLCECCNGMHLIDGDCVLPTSRLRDIVRKERLHGVTTTECARALLTFHPALRRMIFNAFDIEDGQECVEGVETFDAARSIMAMNHSAINNPGILRILEEYLVDAFPSFEPETIKDPLGAAQELAKKQESERDVEAKALFTDINGGDDAGFKKHANPMTINARDKEANNRTPLMQLIWMSEKANNRFDALFKKMLKYKAEFIRDAYHTEIHRVDLALQDYDGNTALILAVRMRRFDYALKIAKTMDGQMHLHPVFALRAKDKAATAYDLAVQEKERGNETADFKELLTILEKHDARLKAERPRAYNKLAKKMRNLSAKQRRKHLNER